MTLHSRFSCRCKSYTAQCENLSVVTLHSRFSCRCKSYTAQCENLSVVTLHSRFSCRCKSYIRLSVSISLVCTLIKSSVGDKSPSLDEPGYQKVTLFNINPGGMIDQLSGEGQGRPFRAKKEERK